MPTKTMKMDKPKSVMDGFDKDQMDDWRDRNGVVGVRAWNMSALVRGIVRCENRIAELEKALAHERRIARIEAKVDVPDTRRKLRRVR